LYSPHRLNQALEDAAALGTELSRVADGSKTQADAIQAYEKEMRARVLQEIPISVMQAQMVHSFDTLLQAPFFTHGMHKYREKREKRGERIEVATDAKVV
jgi:2-polyprenyl-6-methoxyphenol hydroxylase-like FAD-dependent oxidoreductase